MLSQTQTHTILRSPGPAADPAFSPSTPEREKRRMVSDKIRQDCKDGTGQHTVQVILYLTSEVNSIKQLQQVLI